MNLQKPGLRHEAAFEGADRALMERVEAFRKKHGLSGREGEILWWVVRGTHPKAIGEAIGCGYESVRTHLRRMCRKLNCSGTRELLVRFLGDAVREEALGKEPRG